jgi:acyl-CoA synthetase (AMP-forming)/AMP-acid ligase II
MKDEDGYFHFVGRADGIIKTSGHMVGPFEVESALMEHPECFDDLGRMLTPEVTASIANDTLERQLAPVFADSRWTSLIARLMAT